MSHTPGPWVVDIERRTKRSPPTMLMVVAEAGGMPGLIVNQPPVVTPTDEANARLIAAAPDLLEIVKAFVAQEVDYMTRNNLGDPEKQHNVKWARAVLAKVSPLQREDSESNG